MSESASLVSTCLQACTRCNSNSASSVANKCSLLSHRSYDSKWPEAARPLRWISVIVSVHLDEHSGERQRTRTSMLLESRVHDGEVPDENGPLVSCLGLP
jgi:hypothetical protein